MKHIFKSLRSYLFSKYQTLRVQKEFRLRLKEYRILQDIEILQVPQGDLPQKKYYKIAFIVPGMPKYSGGHTSILRLGTYLASFGHTVYYITSDNSSIDELKKNSEINLPYYKGEFHNVENITDIYDIGIATGWNTAYYLNKFQTYFSYKTYFIQGFEAGFYPEGDRYYLALNTYKMNFHMISIGHWNKKRIEAIDNNLHVDYIQFPYEYMDYKIKPRKIIIDGMLKLAVYIRSDEPRGSTLLLQSLELLQKRIQLINKNVEINFFGLSKKIKLPFGTNLGQLNLKELLALYEYSHIGIAASFSNISLVPYEMIASGLPVCSFIDGSGPDFFNADSMIFCESTPMSFCSKIIYYIQNTNELNTLLENAQKSIKGDTWENSAKQFCKKLKIHHDEINYV